MDKVDRSGNVVLKNDMVDKLDELVEGYNEIMKIYKNHIKKHNLYREWCDK